MSEGRLQRLGRLRSGRPPAGGSGPARRWQGGDTVHGCPSVFTPRRRISATALLALRRPPIAQAGRVPTWASGTRAARRPAPRLVPMRLRAVCARPAGPDASSP